MELISSGYGSSSSSSSNDDDDGDAPPEPVPPGARKRARESTEGGGKAGAGPLLLPAPSLEALSVFAKKGGLRPTRMPPPSPLTAFAAILCRPPAYTLPAKPSTTAAPVAVPWVRSFPHVKGNWPSHIYFTVPLSAPVRGAVAAAVTETRAVLQRRPLAGAGDAPGLMGRPRAFVT